MSGVAVVTGSYICVVSAAFERHHWKQDSTAAEGQCAHCTGYSSQWRDNDGYI